MQGACFCGGNPVQWVGEFVQALGAERNLIVGAWKRLGAALMAPLMLWNGVWAAGLKKADPRMFLELEELEPAEVLEKAPAGPEALGAESGEAWKLILVNAWCELDENFQVELRALPNGMSVDARIYDDLMDMLEACRGEGLAPKICSAYRSRGTQKRLYNNKVARLRNAGYGSETAAVEAAHWVAVPGTSEHHTGLALDIVATSYQGLTRRQEKTAEQKWLMEHCWEYGFILRYPDDKKDVTGIYYEPWHYRYVGREAALEMRDSGLCLEEYLAEKTLEIGINTPKA